MQLLSITFDHCFRAWVLRQLILYFKLKCLICWNRLAGLVFLADTI